MISGWRFWCNHDRYILHIHFSKQYVTFQIRFLFRNVKYYVIIGRIRKEWICTLSLYLFLFYNLFSSVSQAALVKNPLANAGDRREAGLIPEEGRSPGGGNGNPLQYSCLENPTDRVAWWATVHGIAKSKTWLSDWTHAHTHIPLVHMRDTQENWTTSSSAPGCHFK